MTLRTLVYAGIAAAALPAAAVAQTATLNTFVSVTVSDAPVAGQPVQVLCTATDPAGISRITLRATDAAEVSTVLGVAFGMDSLSVSWVPPRDGPWVLRCRANGQSTANAEEIAAREVIVAKGTAPAPQPIDPMMLPVGAPPPPEIGASVFQADLPAKLRSPRRVAATPEGDVFVVDADKRLHRLTRKGALVGTSLDEVISLAAGTDVVWAGRLDGSIVALDARTGRLLRRVETGFSEGPVGLALDEARDRLWVALYSGAVQMRSAQGELLRHITETPASPLVRVTDVAVTPAGVVWVALDRNLPTGVLHAFDAETGDYVKSVGGAEAGEIRVVGAVAAAWNRLYLADVFLGNVRVLDAASGATLEVLGSRGTEEGQLLQPSGAAVLANGDLLVANMGAGRLDRFGTGAPLPECAGDSDCDYMPDAWELANGMNPLDPQDALADADGDGLNAVEEFLARSNPRATDTDGDGYADATEVLAGFDATDPFDHVPVMTVDVPALADPGLVEMVGAVKDRGLSPCAFAWRQLAGPAIALDPAALSQSFISRRGVYRFDVKATCGGVAGPPATLDVTIRNLPPIANATRAVAVPADGRARLSAQFASDANGDSFSFWWDQVLGPPIVSAKPGASLVIATVGAPGLYGFRVGVTDSTGRQGAAEVPVVVVGPGGAPTAIASSPVLGRAGGTVALDASASYRSTAAAFLWKQTAGPAVSLDTGTGEVATFAPAQPGRYTFDVSIVDGALRSPPATVDVFVAPADGALPAASVAAPAVAAVGAPVTLDASGSASGSGAALKYAWRQVSGPAAGLSRTDKAKAALVPFAPGSIELELVVEDGTSVGVPVRTRVEARAGGKAIPVAVASAPATAVVGQDVVLSGAASVGATKWSWTQVEGPWVPVDGTASAWFTPVTPGVYGFELEVDDGSVRSAPARVTVVVFPN